MRTAVVVGLLLGARVASAQDAPAPPPAPAPAPAAGSDAPLPEQRVEGPHIAIRGRVITKLGRGVRGATVSVEGTDVSTTTDKQGFYVLPGVSIGASLVVDAPGYQTSLANVTGADIDDVVMLGLQEATETIEIKGDPPPPSPGAAQLERTEMERVAGTGNDLVRTLSAMPGVVNFQLPLGYAGVVIRGSSPQDSKILVDDFEVPTLYHDIAFRSVIPTEAIDKLDYIPGGFDVGYGRAASGIVSLTTRAGAEQRSDQAEVSVIDGGLIAQGSIDKDTTYMIGFRRSLIDLILPHIIPPDVDLSLTTVPRYYDEQFRIDHRLNEHWRIRLSSVGSDDALEIFADKAEDPDKRFYNRTRFARLTAAASYHDGPWTAQLALSGMPDEFIFESGIYQFVQIKELQSNLRGEVTRTADDVSGLKDVVVRAGAEAQVTRYSIDLALPQETREGQPMGNFNQNDTSETFHGVVWTPDFALWTALQASLDPRLRATVALRFDEFARIDDFAIQPRGELSYKLSPQLTARYSTGSFVRPPEYQSELLAGNVHPEKAFQNILGVQWEPRDGVRVQGSLYYTDRTDLLTYGADGKSLLNQGRGTTYGAEILATYRADPYFGFLSYSYSHSTRVDAPGDASRLFDFDQPHSLNISISRKTKKWQLGARFQLYSGLPITPAIGSIYNSDQNVYQPIYGPVNSDRAPIHHELDIRIDRYFKLGGANMSYFLDVQNVYLDQSVVAYFYSYDYSQRAAFTSIPIIPSVGLRGQF